MRSYWFLSLILMTLSIVEIGNFNSKSSIKNMRMPASEQINIDLKILLERGNDWPDPTPILKAGILANWQYFGMSSPTEQIEIDFITKEIPHDELPLLKVEFISFQNGIANYHEAYIRTNGKLFIIDWPRKITTKEPKITFLMNELYVTQTETDFIINILPERFGLELKRKIASPKKVGSEFLLKEHNELPSSLSRSVFVKLSAIDKLKIHFEPLGEGEVAPVLLNLPIALPIAFEIYDDEIIQLILKSLTKK